MTSVTSQDGSAIALVRRGQGPAVVLVDGALCSTTMGPQVAIAEQLAGDFTVYHYDRRGRGASEDRQPYAVEREVEDLAAVIAAAGGSAHVFGHSSGAALALEAARQGLPITRLALFEPPFIVDAGRAPLPAGYLATMEAHVRRGEADAAIKQFMAFIGVPWLVRTVMPFMPFWKELRPLAATLPHDIRLVQDFQTGQPLPAGRWDHLSTPTLVLDGARSPAWMRHGTAALAAALPAGRGTSLPGQNHQAGADVLVPELRAFFSAT